MSLNHVGDLRHRQMSVRTLLVSPRATSFRPRVTGLRGADYGWKYVRRRYGPPTVKTSQV